MLKGCQRRIYHIQKTDSAIFDEVYFVLKKRVSSEYTPGLPQFNDSEMAEEAKRILWEMCRSCQEPPKSSQRRRGKALAFVLGAFSSTMLIGTAALLLVLL